MKKINYSINQNKEKTFENELEKVGVQNSIIKKSILDKIHSINDSMNINNSNKPKYIRRKNYFRRDNENQKREKTSRTKSNNKMRSKSTLKKYSKNKLLNEFNDTKQEKRNSLNNKMNQIYNYNNVITEPSSNSNNTFFTNNTTNNGLNASNNIIININNFNKITPTPTNNDLSSKSIPMKKSKDKEKNSNKKESKKTQYLNNNDTNKNHLKKIISHKNRKEYNYYINGQSFNIDNNSQSNLNNNIFLNQIDNIKTSNENNDNNDNISIHTYHTINEGNHNINSSNNTSNNREYSNRTLIKKNNNYQDNIMLKKKQLGMYSPLSILKNNFDISPENLNDNKYNNRINSLNYLEYNNNNKYNEASSTNNDNNIINDNEDLENNMNINDEIKKKNSNKGEIKNKYKYNFNYYNINKNDNGTINSENKANKNNIKTLNNNNNNKNQVKNIISTLNRIKNTKQIYNNKKALAFNKIHRKKEKMPLYSINNSSFWQSKYSYSKLLDTSINNHFYYSRSNSKNVLNRKNKLSKKMLNFSQKRTCKSNQKLLERSFVSETERIKKKKSTNELLLSYQKKRNKMYIFKNINNNISNNIRSEYSYNDKEKNKSSPDLVESMTINTINSNKKQNHYSNLNNKKNKKENNTNVFNKNNTSNAAYISANNLLSSSNNNKLTDDAYENTTIANINKHCDNLLSRINQKIKEEKEKDKDKEKEENDKDKEEKENQEEKDKDKEDKEKEYNPIEPNTDLFQKKIISKKIISNASLCRKGLNRPDEMMKINQDALFKVKFGDLNYSYYGVCDGHGPSGHFVSDFIKSNIAFIIYKQLKTLLLQNQKITNVNLNEVDDSNIDFTKLFKDCFSLMDSKLIENKSIDIELSGTTCVSLLFCENRIISANVGDSRAIKGFFNSNKNKWDYIALSRDHKPSDKDESERIIKCKGIIHPYIDDDGNYAGPDRVWMDDELPGLAMSRSFGDEVATRVGVFSEPEVKIFPYSEEDNFIIIGSDGLWEYVSNEEVIDIVSEYFENKDCDGAVSKLYEISHERWVQYDDYIDDISIIVVFLE